MKVEALITSLLFGATAVVLQTAPLMAMTNDFTSAMLNNGMGDGADLALSKLNADIRILSNAVTQLGGQVAVGQSSSPSFFLPQSIPGLRMWWSPQAFVGYTNYEAIPNFWPDQTGFVLSNGAGLAATYRKNVLNGNAGIYFNGNPIFACANAATASMLTNCMFAIVCRDMLQQNSNIVMMCFDAGNTGNPGFFVNSFIARGPAPNSAAAGTMSVDITNTVIATPVINGHNSIDILVGRFSLAGPNELNVKIWHNGYPAYDSTLEAGGVGGQNIPISGGDGMQGTLYLGGKPNPGSFSWIGYLGDVLFFTNPTNAYTDDQATSLNEMLLEKYLPGPAFVIDGASLETGAGTILYSNFAQLASPLLPQYNLVTTAVGGCGSGAQYTNMLSWINTKTAAGGYVFLGSDVVLNDTKWFGLPLSTSESFITNYAAAVHASGRKFILGGAASANWWETNNPAFTRSNLIVWERANWQSFADGFADYSVDALVGTNDSCYNLTIYPDGDHVHYGSLAYVSTITNEFIPAWLHASRR
jgi:hypothetical protein